MITLLAAVVLSNSLVRAELDDTGCLVSLKENASGRELVQAKTPFVEIAIDRRRIRPLNCRGEGDRLVFGFGAEGEIELKTEPFEGGWTFRTAKFGCGRAAGYYFGEVKPVMGKYIGRHLNGLSDDDSFAATRVYNEGGRFVIEDGTVKAYALKEDIALDSGISFGFAAGPRSAFVPSMRAMTLAAGVPHSQYGGAWALGAPILRRSYLMAYEIAESTADDWLDLCRRAGVGTLHMDECWLAYGHYELNPAYFPSGRKGFKELVDKAHAMGLTCDIHTLTSSIGWKDSWLTPECSDGIDVNATYTLANDLDDSKKETEVVIREEKLFPQHDLTLTYIGNGNLLKIGTELLSYSGISKERPWRFTGVKRGAFGTTVKPHRAGDRCDYARAKFGSILADADHPLADEIAKVQGDLFGVCGFDQIYLDGLDGVNGVRKRDKFARKIFAAAVASGKAPVYEDSAWQPANWWWHSRMGANDYMHWGVKESLDLRFAEYCRNIRMGSLLELEMGWWPILMDNSNAPGYRLDDHEYFGSKCAGFGTAMSIHTAGRYPPTRAMKPSFFRYITALGWYERFRYANAFNDEALARFRLPGAEQRLRLAEDGVWRLTETAAGVHRVVSPDTAGWNFRAERAAEGAIRVTALMNSSSYEAKGAETVLDASTVEAKCNGSAKGVKVESAASAEREGAIRITARNASSVSRGAWARVGRAIAYPYLDLGSRRGIGVWVKGDASGALLNVQLASPREHHLSKTDHHVRLDFSGWRYFEFNLRERDVAHHREYGWPYDSSRVIDYAMERSPVRYVSEVNLYLNDLPVGGGTEIEVSPVKVLEGAGPVTMEKAVVTVGGAEHRLPFGLRSGDFAELEGGFWTRYDADGVELERARGEVPRFAAGDNPIRFSAVTDKGLSPRAEVRLTAFGRGYAALKPGYRDPWMDYEAMEPVVYAPKSGFAELPPLVVRKGERAKVAFDIYGTTGEFELQLGGEKRRLPAIGEGEYLTCRDGRNWQLRYRGKGGAKIVKTGEIEPFAAVSGSVSIKVLASESAFLRLNFAKSY